MVPGLCLHCLAVRRRNGHERVHWASGPHARLSTISAPVHPRPPVSAVALHTRFHSRPCPAPRGGATSGTSHRQGQTRGIIALQQESRVCLRSCSLVQLDFFTRSGVRLQSEHAPSASAAPLARPDSLLPPRSFGPVVGLLVKESL